MTNIYETVMEARTPFPLLGFIFGISFLLSVLAVGLVVNPLNKYECLVKYSDYSPTHSFFGGCRIEFEGKLTPVDMIKNININK